MCVWVEATKAGPIFNIRRENALGGPLNKVSRRVRAVNANLQGQKYMSLFVISKRWNVTKDARNLEIGKWVICCALRELGDVIVLTTGLKSSGRRCQSYTGWDQADVVLTITSRLLLDDRVHIGNHVLSLCQFSVLFQRGSCPNDTGTYKPLIWPWCFNGRESSAVLGASRKETTLLRSIVFTVY